MHLQNVFAAVVAAAVLAGCATTPPVSQPASSDAARTAAVLAASNRWTGTLNPTQGRTGAAVTTARQKAFGTVELTVAPNRPTMTHARLTVSVPVEPGLTNLGWAIHQGGCGSGNPPVMSPGAFPMMVLSVNGRGSIDDDIPFTLPESGNYHLNVFRGNGTQLSDVITCGNLRRDS